MHLDDAFSEDEIDKHILNILAHLSRIFHDNRHFVNYGNGFMCKLNEMGTNTLSSLHIFYTGKDPKEQCCATSLHLTFKPCQLIEDFITIQNGESGSLHTVTFLDGERL